jgi:hypothetical protein
MNEYVDWVKVPKGYDWVARDGWSGSVYAYKHEPKPLQSGKEGWRDYELYPETGAWLRVSDDAIIAPLPPWRESLRRRPEARA